MNHTRFTSDDNAVHAQLKDILGSKVFARAHRSRRFLSYLVEHSLEDSGTTIKEYCIALDVFGRDASYDPSVDATVRVEAGRLRSRLREYYAEEGRTDPLLIEVPKGGYRAVIQRRTLAVTAPADARPKTAEPVTGTRPSRPALQLGWLIVLAFVLGLTLGYAVAFR